MTPGKLAFGAAVSAFVVVVASCGSSDDSSGWSPGGDAAGGTSGHDGSSGGPDSSDTSWVPFDVIGGEGSLYDNFNSDSGCAANTVSAQQTPANILFLIDRTGSMRCNPPPTMQTAECEQQPQKKDPSSPSKWEITREALKQAMIGLEAVKPQPKVGIAYFNNDDYCGYPDKPLVDILALTQTQLDAVNGSLDTVDPWGATPIIGTMMRAFAYLQQNAGQFEGNTFVVLLTDGGETCDPNGRPLLVQKAQEATLIGIRTFVLGAPGSESERGFLSQIAYNGGTAASATCDHSGADPTVGDCHMDMTQPNIDFATELAKNLQAISAQALTCVFDVPKPGDGGKLDPSKVNVTYTPGSGGPALGIPKDDNKPCNDPSNNGWQYVENMTKIQLCGSACTTVKGDTGAQISIVLGCQTQEVPH